ncbi:F-box/kelch-repeat protein At1g30090-like [Andrographis paniculata]|uniref:F-box/kelch-repeat protein At1g30090-like n=1 Tax=Andrographis paniculata TaxID=175694 RepID=UPI0021E7BCB1|nr:F-box/kelch-repeat protein At1g30090-like [Andrographis paniculata]XP_051136328.1 F-box/kelch-repeat protein At1g30090-like [Andrographis paniculata]XP_051136329.1 F-box/kelch-repeat protein At1g30090-like [Andrographis paniculata]
MQRVRVSQLGDSQMTLSPKFKFPTLNAASLESNQSAAGGGEPLIPGLPDDIGLLCLLRVSVDKHATCKAVCRRWHSIFGTKDHFFTLRKELSFHDPWLFVFASHRYTGKIEWKVLDLKKFTWHSIAAMPCKDKVCPQGFRCVSIPHDGALYVCGGVVSDVDCPLNLVLKYEACKNRWTAMKKMITGRSYFASGVIDGMVYVAGGNSADLFELDSGEALDPKNGAWKPIADMGANMMSYDAAVLDGRLLMTEGWLWPFYAVPRGRVYDPSTDKWESMAAGLREGWTGSSVVIDGHLFVVPEHERAKVKVYDAGNDSWDIVEGTPLPERIRKPFCVSSSGRRMYVVGRSFGVVVGDVSKVDLGEGKWRFGVKWEVVDGPASMLDLVPSSAQVLFA